MARRSRQSARGRADTRIYGYGDRFGLIYVELDTWERIPKLSAQWFRAAARRNAVV
jgi:beta-glucosidase